MLRCDWPWVVTVVLTSVMTSALAGDLTRQEQDGKRFYRQGIAEGAQVVTASIGQAPLILTAEKMPCASCHGQDGLGRPEAGVAPTNITWSNLTKPYGLRHDNGRSHPPYSFDTLIRAVTDGVDPAGNALDPTMPRYTLNSSVARDLVAYLQRLGTDSDQGVSSSEIAVATIVPADGPVAEIGSLVRRLLAGYFDRLNREGGIYNRKIVLKTVSFDASRTAVDALQQLANETEIFAVVAPVTTGQGTSVSEFADKSGLPVIGPLMDTRRLGVDRGGLTFYLTVGLVDQTRALMRYARDTLVLANPRIAMVSSADNDALGIGEAIRRQCQDADWTPPVSLDLTSRSAMADVASQLHLAGVDTIFYHGHPALLAALLEQATWPGRRPVILTTSASVTPGTMTLAQQHGVRMFVVFPHIPGDQSPEARELLHSLQVTNQIPAEHLAMQIATMASARILIEGLQRAGRNLSRTNFVTALAALRDFKTGLLPPVSFDANRRTGVRGAYIVTFPAMREAQHVWIPLPDLK